MLMLEPMRVWGRENRQISESMGQNNNQTNEFVLLWLMQFPNLGPWFYALAVILAISLAIGLEKMYPHRRFYWRKGLHIVVIFNCAMAAMWEESVWVPLLGWLASVLLAISIFKGWFEEADAGGASRKPWGMLYFSMSFALLTSLPFCISGITPEYMKLLRWMNGWSFSVLAFADGLAGLLGRWFISKKEGVGLDRWTFSLSREKKSWFGFLVVAIVTLLTSVLFILETSELLLDGAGNLPWNGLLVELVLMSVFVGMVELITDRGSDNLFVVLSVWLFSGSLGLGLMGEPHKIFLVGYGFSWMYMGFSLVAAYWLFVKGWLSNTGAVMAWILAFVVVMMANWSLWPLVVFLSMSTLIGKFRLRGVKGISGDEKEGKPRDRWQVLANGGLFMVFALLAFLAKHGWLKVIDLGMDSGAEARFYFMALVSLSVSCADTLSSEIGQWLGGEPYSITSGARMPKGVSGGVTVAGFFGAMLGSFSIALFWLFSDGSENYAVMGLTKMSGFVWLLGFGMVGTMVDSLLGDLFQAKYRWLNGELSDKPENGNFSNPAKGWVFISNDLVNAITNLFLVIVCWFVFF
jgi:uncharacterized protein (TIGR00297 family)